MSETIEQTLEEIAEIDRLKDAFSATVAAAGNGDAKALSRVNDECRVLLDKAREFYVGAALATPNEQ